MLAFATNLAWPRERKPVAFTERAIQLDRGGVVVAFVMEKAVSVLVVVEKLADLGAEGFELRPEIYVHSSPVAHTGSRFSTNAFGPSLKSG